MGCRVGDAVQMSGMLDICPLGTPAPLAPVNTPGPGRGHKTGSDSTPLVRGETQAVVVEFGAADQVRRADHRRGLAVVAAPVDGNGKVEPPDAEMQAGEFSHTGGP
jgi:hypothetical protein